MFATSIAEEGMDIPRCDTVIRYNYRSDMVSLIQARGIVLKKERENQKG